MAAMGHKDLLEAMFQAAIAAAQPDKCVPPHLPAVPEGRLVVIGAGKASAAMARAVDEHRPGPLSGLVVTRYGYAVALRAHRDRRGRAPRARRGRRNSGKTHAGARPRPRAGRPR